MASKSSSSKNADASLTAPGKAALPSAQATRETVESIVVAFILAFFFRTFEAEAFVIPTGSMAPTLQGVQKDLYCPECGTNYRAGASSENPDEQAQGEVVVQQRDVNGAVRQVVMGPPANKVTVCVCPQCGFRRTDVLDPSQEKSFSGDRILVSKFAYDIADPQRWDVIVFRFPGDAKMNYIKRLIGLPHESLSIDHGDVFIRPDDAAPGTPQHGKFQIARKPPHKLLAMLQPVDDNQHIPVKLDDAGWPRRWQLMTDADAVAWKERLRPIQHSVRIHGSSQTVEARAQSFDADSTAGTTHWLVYKHWRPQPQVWQDLASKTPPRRISPPDGELGVITDFYAYNAVNSPPSGPNTERTFAQHWVGDLAVECEVRLHEQRGKLELDLVEGGYHHTCRIDLTTGVATLGVRGHAQPVAVFPGPPRNRLHFAVPPLEGATVNDPGEKPFIDLANGAVKLHPTAQTHLKSGGTTSAKILFTQCDDELRLWIDGDLVTFDHATTFAGENREYPTEADRMPVRVGVDGANLSIEQMRVLRDVYYIADQTRPNAEGPNLHDTAGFVPFVIGADQFFALGDNSPASQDSRIWTVDEKDFPHTVERRLLIGKALFIYWPHSLDYWFPFCPNFPRMGFVR